MRYARIENNIVKEIIDFNPEGKFHPSLTWAKCTTTTKVEDVYTDGVFQKPEPPSQHDLLEDELNALTTYLPDSLEDVLRWGFGFTVIKNLGITPNMLPSKIKQVYQRKKQIRQLLEGS